MINCITLHMLRLEIPLPPMGKERARENFHTPKRTALAERIVWEAWKESRNQRIEGAIGCEIWAYHEKAKSNKMDFPCIKPDWDNIGKLISDGLNELAYHDDCQIVDARVIKRWTTRTHGYIVVKLWSVQKGSSYEEES